MVIDVKTKLLGCLAEKCGSSSWHQIFWEFRFPGKEPIKYFGETNYRIINKMGAYLDQTIGQNGYLTKFFPKFFAKVNRSW